VFSVLELVANHENSFSISFNNYGGHDKILAIFTDNFSDITSESEKRKRMIAIAKASNKTTDPQCVNVKIIVY